MGDLHLPDYPIQNYRYQYPLCRQGHNRGKIEMPFPYHDRHPRDQEGEEP